MTGGPGHASDRGADDVLLTAFARIDRTGLAVAAGIVCALLVFTATLLLVAKGGVVVGPNLALLGEFFVGYRVSIGGAIIGLGYGFAAGFVWGWLLAFLFNLTITLYCVAVRLREEASSLISLS